MERGNKEGIAELRCCKCNHLLARIKTHEDVYLTPHAQTIDLSDEWVEFKCDHNSKGRRCKQVQYLAVSEHIEMLHA